MSSSQAIVNWLNALDQSDFSLWVWCIINGLIMNLGTINSRREIRSCHLFQMGLLLRLGLAYFGITLSHLEKTSWSPSCVTQQTFLQLPTSSSELSSIGLYFIQQSNYQHWAERGPELLTAQTPTRPGKPYISKVQSTYKFRVRLCNPNLETGQISMIFRPELRINTPFQTSRISTRFQYMTKAG